MSFSEKLYQNFIEDDRWLLLVNGLKVTILVTLFALLVGVIIGFTVAIIRSLHDKTGNIQIANNKAGGACVTVKINCNES